MAPALQHTDGVDLVLLARQSALLVEAFETEIRGAVGAAVVDGEKVDKSAVETITVVNHVSEQAGVVSQASESAVANVQSVASATEELASSENEVTNLVHRAEEFASGAVEKADRASKTVAEMAEASNAINGIVVFIEDLARRTNMLALNASIEAQRAGAAGKGFAVVAGEVKDLAKQTATATRDIREKISGIKKTTEEAIEAIGVIAQAVSAIQGINGEVAASVTQQAAATREISRNAQETTTRVTEVTGSISKIATEARTALDLSMGMEKGAAGIANRLRDMRGRLGVVVKTSEEAKRAIPRLPVDLPAKLLIEGQSLDGRLTLIGVEGCNFRPLDRLASEPSFATLELPWLGQMSGTAKLDDNGCVCVHFDHLPEDTYLWLKRLIERLDIFDLDILAIGATGAKQASEALEHALERGEITTDDLFDEDYQVVPGSDPLQHMTRFVPLADRLFPPIQEPLMAINPRVVAVCAVDRNGYLPVNALKYSQPQGKDPAWNKVNCRNRRWLNDPVGLAAGRNLEKMIIQTYIRELGSNSMVLFKDLAMPITVKGRHWGNVRVTYRP